MSDVYLYQGEWIHSPRSSSAFVGIVDNLDGRCDEESAIDKVWTQHNLLDTSNKGSRNRTPLIALVLVIVLSCLSVGMLAYPSRFAFFHMMITGTSLLDLETLKTHLAIELEGVEVSSTDIQDQWGNKIETVVNLLSERRHGKIPGHFNKGQHVILSGDEVGGDFTIIKTKSPTKNSTEIKRDNPKHEKDMLTPKRHDSKRDHSD